jgi:hypothetical protein
MASDDKYFRGAVFSGTHEAEKSKHLVEEQGHVRMPLAEVEAIGRSKSRSIPEARPNPLPSLWKSTRAGAAHTRNWIAQDMRTGFSRPPLRGCARRARTDSEVTCEPPFCLINPWTIDAIWAASSPLLRTPAAF